MEPHNNDQITDTKVPSVLHQVTPLSKYLAMALFVALPFLGGWIGYTLAPEKVVEVEKVVIAENATQISNEAEPVNINELSWSMVSFDLVPFTIQYPGNWEFSCCGDMDTRSNHFFYKTRTVENQNKGDILFTNYSVFDPDSSFDSPTLLSVSEQFELLKDSYLNVGSLIGYGNILDVTSYIYSMNSGEEVHAFLYKDKIYSIRFLNPNEDIKQEFLRRVAASSSI